MKKYNPQEIEKRWQDFWEKNQTFQAKDNSKKPKKFVLVEFPYPSGAGLHMGHLRPYVAADVYARYHRMKGFETLFPIGWDAFGLPAENYAIKMGVHPSITTKQNVANAKKQMQSWGLSFDWSREINTTDPDYYKWTQWLFLQFYKKGLAYEATGLINWCPKDKTGLANEEVIDGKCERCGTVVEKKELRQWYLKITEYAEKLLEGLKTLEKWPEAVKVSQENWIGKSVGAEILFPVIGGNQSSTGTAWSEIKVFTTRPDTIFGATYLVLAPEHPLVELVLSKLSNSKEILKYIEATKNKKETDRMAEDKEKTGVELKGFYAINPASKEQIPVWIADYVLNTYGTGAIMAVPAHDARDFEFAKKFGLPIKKVVAPDENFVLVRGCPKSESDMTQPENSWKHWLNEKLQSVGLKSELPNMPTPWLPNYNSWKTEFEKCLVNENATIVCHSCGAAFVVRWLGESKRKIKRLVLVAPAKIAEEGDDRLDELYNFEIKPYIKDLVSETIILLSNDKERHLKAAEIYKKALNAKVINFKNKGHFTFNTLQTRQFPELFDILLNLFNHPNEEYGVVIDSSNFTGQKTKDAIPKMAEKFGKLVTHYKLRDWVFSRQRYWGEPIPLIHCEDCGVVAVPDKDLPVKLPNVKKYEPTGTGESPLADIKNWLKTKCPKCGKLAWRETNTMPQWAGSSWYWLRYTDPKNKKKFSDLKKQKYWTPVDVYFGGMEHTTLHLLYSRFWNLFLFDQGLVTEKEPYSLRKPHGIVLGPDGEKMSKSRGNVVDPQVVVKQYGADVLRMYEMFLGPHEAMVSWSDKGIIGVARFLDRIWNWVGEIVQAPHQKVKSEKLKIKNEEPDTVKDSEKVQRELNRLIKKVTEDIEAFRFNTSISAFMEFHNAIKDDFITLGSVKKFLSVLYPFAPHIAEELNQQVSGVIRKQGSKTLQTEAWPAFDESLILETQADIVIQINGKVRGKIKVATNSSEAQVQAEALKLEPVKQALEGETIKRTIYIKGRLMNLVI